ncbi:ImmA/IrrE family metallo-endopeptidase [Listeria booriae]|uniref:ImmA/IrrE family metallo-endopeptidase n=1 Tax=Listeria booriae TaxID=1552123 RepID=UPI001626EE37|nr:ImmA/IrrE family metallo-endopeptidase [Listeria booriae]MBC1235226.1 ImmA/IrrE family metallo-endopeptidase [Listeria booriae]
MKINDLYTPSYIEERISQLYMEKGILTPDDLSIENILTKFNFFVMEGDLSFAIAEFGGIILPRGLNREAYIEKFHHEFTHLLFHSGNQKMMNYLSRQKQEQDAQNYVLFTCIPYHMLHYIDFEHEDIVEHTCELFNVPANIAKTRIKKMKNQLLINCPEQLLSIVL